MPRQSTLARPARAAAKGSTEVVSFIGPQVAPRVDSRRRSMWCMPPKLRTAMPTIMTTELRSPLASRCDSAHSPVPQRKGWRVTERMPTAGDSRSEEHTSELQSLMRISYAVFCLKKKKKNINLQNKQQHQTP